MEKIRYVIKIRALTMTMCLKLDIRSIELRIIEVTTYLIS